MKKGAATAPVGDVVEGVICQNVLYKRKELLMVKKKQEQDVKGSAVNATFCLLHLGFWVDDGEALLADGYSYNIWETLF